MVVAARGWSVWHRGLAVGLMVAFAMVFALPAHAGDGAAGRALVLYSFEDGLPWQRLFRKGLMEELARSPPDQRPALYEERLDVARIGGKAASDVFASHLAQRYDGIPPDVVVTESIHAAVFLHDHPHLFPGARRVYVNPGKRDWDAADGVSVRIGDDFFNAIDVITRLRPKLRRLVVVADRSLMLRQRMADLRQVLESYAGRFAVEIWDDFAIGDLPRLTSGLEADTAIFFLGVFLDNTGAAVIPYDAVRQLAAAAPVPVFVAFDSLIMGSGAVGGYVLSAERLGHLAAWVAAGRVIAPDAIAALGRDVYGYVFEYGPFRRFGLDEATLPAGAVMLDRPPSLWREYRWQIVGILVAFAVQTVLMAALTATLRARDRALAALEGERRRVAQQSVELRASLKDLARRNEELEVFAYVAAHDLREPLRTVSTYVTLLERRLGDTLDTDGRTFIGFAREAARRLNRLVLDLLDYTRAGRSDEVPRLVETRAMVAAVVAGLESVAAEAGAWVTVDENLPPLVVCEGDLRSLFRNLIDNALKYRDPDRAPVVGISAHREDDGWTFRVSDNGEGIDPQYFAKIFVLFQRLTPRENSDGTGIGLGICRKIVEKYGGRIWVESTPGEGSRFLFTLPDAVPAEGEPHDG